MGITSITTGGARGSENKSNAKIGAAGDQKQSSSDAADYSGEVKLSKYSSEKEFKSVYWKEGSYYEVYRPIDPNHAATIANLCIRACNNPNIGYSQYYESSGDESRQGIFNKGVDATTPINCDCSSLGSYCVTQATGVKVNTSSSGMPSALKGTGKFMDPFPVSAISFETNPPYNGDVLVKNGHVEMVVAGNPREGRADEVVSGTWKGGPVSIVNYTSTYGQTYLFSPRTQQPTQADSFFSQSYGGSQNGSYAWGRFSEILRSSCNLCRTSPRKWYLYTEDGYSRGMAPSLGAVMCFTNIYDASHPGLVCIVEGIERDGVRISQRKHDTGSFEYTKFTKRNGSWDMDLDGDGKYEFVFQGFIYNPAVNLLANAESALESFIRVAKEQVNTNGSYTQQHTGLNIDSDAWSAGFIVAVAKNSGSILNVIVPNTFSCSDIGRIGVIRNMGTWLDGPALGSTPNPQIGDIALFRTSSNMDRASKYAADKAGIIIQIDSNNAKELGTNQGVSYSFKVVMGDCSGKVKSKTYTTSSSTFSGLFRPNWDQVDGTSQSVIQHTNIQGLYTEGTSKEDASIRDLRYVNITNKGIEPSIKSTGLLLSAINYTGMLANLYSVFAESNSSSATDANLVVDLWNNTVDSVYQQDKDDLASAVSWSEAGLVDLSNVTIDNLAVNPGGSVDVIGHFHGQAIRRTIALTNTVKLIYSLLNSQIQNEAGVVGIMANMYQESLFNCAFSNTAGKCGLIGWDNYYTDDIEMLRCDEMKLYCSTYSESLDWRKALSAQIEFLFYEANTVDMFKQCMDMIKRVQKTEDGCVEATRLFLDYFELNNPALRGDINESAEFEVRSDWARGIWKLLFGVTK